LSADHRNYRTEFNVAIREQLAAIERLMHVFNDHAEHCDGQFDALSGRITELQENDAELKRLIIEQGSLIVEQGSEIRALRARLDDHR